MMNGSALCWVQHNHKNHYHLYERSPHGGRFFDVEFENIKVLVLISYMCFVLNYFVYLPGI